MKHLLVQLLSGLALAASLAAAPAKMNVLFIAIDDMRPQLGCYGDPIVKSPHMDKLAAQGVLFTRAFCQQALCSPSRISLLSGRYPSTSGIYAIGPFLREKMPDITTLPQHFKNNGYFTRSLGKVYHVGIDDPQSWTVPPWHSKKPRYGPEGTAEVAKRRKEMVSAGKEIPAKGPENPTYAGPAFESPDVADDDLLDGDNCREAIEAMRALAKNPAQPFFLAVGFANPHVPWVAPKKYWDLYQSENMPLPNNMYPPRNAPAYAAKSGDDFYWYGKVPKDRKILPEFGRDCLHGYLAAISYVDALVGRLLNELEQLKLRQNTLVILWADHGYYMGEHGWWGGKHNNYEGATRAPLMISVPGMKTAGQKCPALVEFVDIYPSLSELCGLPKPVGTEGVSFAGLVANPGLARDKYAFSWYPKGGYLGIAMRTDRYRYVEWLDKDGTAKDLELYDHQNDPAENENIAVRPEYKSVLDDLARQMAARKPASAKNPPAAAATGNSSGTKAKTKKKKSGGNP